MRSKTFAVVVFPGSNCDRDCRHAIEQATGADVRMIWHQETDLGEVDCVVLPGGFSYGDYLRPGALAKVSPVMSAVRAFADRGGPVLGICNGFQILLETEMLPGAMIRNRALRFHCDTVHLRVASARSAFTGRLALGEVVRVPIAHADGNYFIDDDGLAALRDHDQIVLQYASPAGDIDVGHNPNGSAFNIAGISNRAGNVVGMMPHPERACEAVLGSEDGRAFFASALDAIVA